MSSVTRRAWAAAVVALVLAVLVAPSLPGAQNVTLRASATPVMVSTASSLPAQSIGTPPTVLLIDTSGSMSEQVSGGGTRLDAATNASLDLVTAWPDDSLLGVMAYPLTRNSCDSQVQYHVPLGPLQVGRAMTAVRGLTADGNTPTGPALQAAASVLPSGGGVIVLVSDGESQCDPDPCEVAQQLAAQDVFVVNTVGFQISGAGEEELRCIAQATGGVYRSVDDADDLTSTVLEQSLPPVRLSMDVPEEMLAAAGAGPSAGTELTGTVRNTGSVSAADVRVSLRFTRNDDSAGQLLVTPPIRYLGNLAPGQTQSVRFRVLPDVATTTANWQALVSSHGAVVHQLSGEVEVNSEANPDMLGSVLRGVERIAVVGDSYSSGEGSGDYLRPGSFSRTVTDVGVDLCHRSLHTSPAKIFGPQSTTIIACSGAVTAHLYESQPSGLIKQKPQLESLRELAASNEPPQAVFLTFGGNDIGFAGFVITCAIWPHCGLDGTTKPEIIAHAAALHSSLLKTYLAVDLAVNSERAVAARDGHVAPVVVLPYVRIVPRSLEGYVAEDGCLFGLSRSEVHLANRVTDTLNNSARMATKAARDAGRPVYFVDEAIEAFQPRNTVCDGQDSHAVTARADLSAWRALLPANKQEIAHPNRAGYAVIARAIAAWSTALPEEEVVEAGPALPPLTVGRADPPLLLDVVTTPARLGGIHVPGGPVEIQGSGYSPQSTVVHWVESSPRSLGTSIATEDGQVQTTLRLPTELTPGQHTVHSYGLTYDGKPTRTSFVLTVHRPHADVAWTVLIASLLLLISVALLWIGISARAPE